MKFTSHAVALGAFAHCVSAVLVADGSPCGIKCGNVPDSTTPADVVCKEADYTGTPVGVVYEQCVSCELTSPYSTGAGSSITSDLQYFLSLLANLSKRPSKSAIYLRASPHIATAAFGMQRLSRAAQRAFAPRWTEHTSQTVGVIMFPRPDPELTVPDIDTLNGACTFQPQPGATLALQGNLFSDDQVNVTAPTPTATFESSAYNGPISVGAIVGIVVGGLVVILVVCACCVVCIGKRRRKAYLRQREQLHAKNWPSHAHAGSEMFETPISQRPLRGWGDSPVSAVTTDGTYPPYFSPYTSQYNSPVSAVEAPKTMGWPQEKGQNIGVAISPNSNEHSYTWSDSKGKDKMDMTADAYEMQEGVNSAGGYGDRQQEQVSHAYNPPLLNHPGYGRHGAASRESPEDDSRR
ncbi:hypothetical protein AAE478_004440 [Parahypoxylon ruwenzoriense]